MSKGITYFCTDSDGNTYTRHSAGHTQARYIRATITRPFGKPAGSKHWLSYSSRPLALYAGKTTIWTQANPKEEALHEIVAVRAYPGRHKVEPAQIAKVTILPDDRPEQIVTVTIL